MTGYDMIRSAALEPLRSGYEGSRRACRQRYSVWYSTQNAIALTAWEREVEQFRSILPVFNLIESRKWDIA